MDVTLYSCFREAVITENRKEYTRRIVDGTGLSYRTVRALIQIINNEPDITQDVLNILIDKDFYTIENMIKVAKAGLLDIIPAEFFSNEEFLSQTGINKLPDRFCADDEELAVFTIHPRILYIGNEAFCGCKNLRQIRLHDNLLEIYDGAFKNCENLQIEEIPRNVYYVGNEAFYGCSSIISMLFPEKTNKVQDRTFYNCENLVDFSSPVPIRVGESAFYGCINLFEVNAVLLSTDTESFAKCKQLDDLHFQNGVIGKRAFMGCDLLMTINFLGGSVLEIQEDAFVGCPNLSSVNIDGYTYQMNETKGYKEITKNLRKFMNDKGKMVTYYDFKKKATVKDIIESLKIGIETKDSAGAIESK